MMKRLLIMFMMMLLFTTTVYAGNEKQLEAETARAEFNVMATDIIKEIETKYAAGDIAVLHNKAGWRQYKYDDLTYKIEFAETGLEHKPYIGTIYVSFWAFGLWDHNKIAYRDTEEAAANIRPSKLLGCEWYPVWEDPYTYVFTYDYNYLDPWAANEWKLVSTQYGDFKHYFKNNKVYTPQELCLIENYSKDPFEWVKYYKDMQN